MCKECEKILTRRGFIKNTAINAVALSTFMSSGLLYAGVKEFSKGDKTSNHIVSNDVKFSNGANHTIKGFLSRPKGEGKFKPIIISHGVGETDYLKYTAARLALVGYAAFVLLIEDKNTEEKQAKGEKKETIDAIVDYLYAQDFIINEGVGMVGFCAAGRQFVVMATEKPYIKAVVSIYGKVTDSQPSPMEVVEKIKIPIQAHFGKIDQVVPLDNAEKFSVLLKHNNKNASTYFYEDVGHSYCNFNIPQGTSPGFDYNYNAAMLTYQRSIDFLKTNF